MAEKLTEAEGANGASPSEYLAILAELIPLDRQKHEVVGKIRAIMKRAKSAGHDTDAMAITARLRRLDPDRRAALVANIFRQASWEGVSLWHEDAADGAATVELANVANAVSNEPGPTSKATSIHADAQIYNDGWNSAKAGATGDDNPGAVGSQKFVTWKAGFDDWQEQNGALGGDASAPAASTAPKRRGRPPAAEAAPAA